MGLVPMTPRDVAWTRAHPTTRTDQTSNEQPINIYRTSSEYPTNIQRASIEACPTSIYGRSSKLISLRDSRRGNSRLDQCLLSILRAYLRYFKPEGGKPNAGYQNMLSTHFWCLLNILRAYLRYFKPEGGKPNAGCQNMLSTHFWCFLGILTAPTPYLRYSSMPWPPLTTPDSPQIDLKSI